MFSRNFDADFFAIMKATEPFALIRFHDGEHALLEKLHYEAASKWSSNGADVWFYDELKASLNPPPGVSVGISPPCCAPRATEYYRRHLKVDKSRITFATLFAHRNYRRFPQLRAKFKDAMVVSCRKGDVKVPPNGVTKRWDMDAAVDQMLKSTRPILVAAGPCANVMISRYWARQDPSKRQTVIDVGAALDMEVHGKRTRHYHEPTSKALYHTCEWDTWKPYAPVTDKDREAAARKRKMAAKFEELQVGGKTRLGGALPRRNRRTGYTKAK